VRATQGEVSPGRGLLEALAPAQNAELLRELAYWWLPAPRFEAWTARLRRVPAAVWRVRGEGLRIVLLAVKEMPLLLAILLVLFLTSEVWQFFGRIEDARFASVFWLFVLCAFLVILFGSRASRREAYEFLARGEDEIAGAARRTAAQPLVEAGVVREDENRAPTLSRWALRWRHLGSLCLQVALVGAVVGLVLAIVGAVAMDPELVEAWVDRGEGDEHEVGRLLDPFGGAFVVTEPLLRVAALLGAFASLTFAVELRADDRLEKEVVEASIRSHVRRYEHALAAWSYYRGRPGSGPQAAPAPARATEPSGDGTAGTPSRLGPPP
jgi:hypothetical protein